jgi:hypothetical protein
LFKFWNILKEANLKSSTLWIKNPLAVMGVLWIFVSMAAAHFLINILACHNTRCTRIQSLGTWTMFKFVCLVLNWEPKFVFVKLQGSTRLNVFQHCATMESNMATVLQALCVLF